MRHKMGAGDFAIGLNPCLHESVGRAVLDEKIGGSVHIALGMNEHFGGTNRSNLHMDLVILRARVWLDGEIEPLMVTKTYHHKFFDYTDFDERMKH